MTIGEISAQWPGVLVVQLAGGVSPCSSSNFGRGADRVSSSAIVADGD